MNLLVMSASGAGPRVRVKSDADVAITSRRWRRRRARALLQPVLQVTDAALGRGRRRIRRSPSAPGSRRKPIEVA